MNLLVTGGCGFIGSNFVRYYLDKHPEDKIIVIDKLTYAAKLSYIDDLIGKRLKFYCLDIASEYDIHLIERAIKGNHIDAILHFAAESHVDRSINNASQFVQSNIVGTYNMVELAKKNNLSKYIQVSSDECYGSLSSTDVNSRFTEMNPIKPSSAYSASKAAADLIVQSYFKTHNTPVCITRCSNNYGPRQHDEKLIPTILRKYWLGKKIPIYGDGRNVRDWIHVLDHCEALDLVLHKGVSGEVYNIGGNNELENLKIVWSILGYLNDYDEEKTKKEYDERVEFVVDRKGHDLRYAIDFSKIERELGWSPKRSFEMEIGKTIDWYADYWRIENYVHN